MTDPSTQPAAETAAFSRARAWLASLWKRTGSAYESLRARVFVWWKTGNRSAATAVAWPALAATVIVLLATCGDAPSLEQRPIAEQSAASTAQPTNPLAPLVARIEALEAQVADLQDPQAPWPQTTARQPSRSATAQRPAATRANPASQPPPGAAWSTPTDLDRALTTFSNTLQEPSK